MFDKKSVDKNQWMIDPNDAVMLLIDHQSGLNWSETSIYQLFARTQARSRRCLFLPRYQPSPQRRFLTALTALSSQRSINHVETYRFIRQLTAGIV